MDGSTAIERRTDETASQRGASSRRWRLGRRTFLAGLTSVVLVQSQRVPARATVPAGYGRGYGGGYR